MNPKISILFFVLDVNRQEDFSDEKKKAQGPFFQRIKKGKGRPCWFQCQAYRKACNIVVNNHGGLNHGVGTHSV